MCLGGIKMKRLVFAVSAILLVISVSCSPVTPKTGDWKLKSGSVGKPVITKFIPMQLYTQANQGTELYWEVSSNTHTVIITSDKDDQNLPATIIVNSSAPYGNVSIKPIQNTVYSLTAENDNGSASDITMVTVGTAGAGVQIAANPVCVAPGGSATLQYNVYGHPFCGTDIIDSFGTSIYPLHYTMCSGNLCFQGKETVKPNTTTTYKLRGQYLPKCTTVWVGPPIVNAFSTSPLCVGQSPNNKVTLHWDVSNAEAMTISAEYKLSGTIKKETIVDLTKTDSAINIYPSIQDMDVYPIQNTVYTLEVKNPCGSDTKTIKVGVQGDGPSAWISADKLCVAKYGTVHLKWALCNCTTTSSNWGVAGLPIEVGERDVTVEQTSRYLVHCVNNYADNPFVTVWVGTPIINAFDCATTPCKCLKPGQNITLHLDINNAEKVTITADKGPDPSSDPAIAAKLQSLWSYGNWNWSEYGPEAVKFNTYCKGDITFTPDPNTTGVINYTVVAENPCGTVTKTLKVAVTNEPIVQFGIGPEYAGSACVDQNGSATLYWNASCWWTIDGLVIANTHNDVVLHPGSNGSKQVTPLVTTIYDFIVNGKSHFATVFVGDPTIAMSSSVEGGSFQPVQCGHTINVPQGQKLCLHLDVTNASDVTINPLPVPDLVSQVQQYWNGTSLTGDVCFIPTSSGSYTIIAANPCTTTECIITVQLEPPPEAPKIKDFYSICKSQSGSPCCIPEGWYPNFGWKVYNTQKIDIQVDGTSINPDPSTVPGILNPTDGQLYTYCYPQALTTGSHIVTLTAHGPGGDTSSTLTLMSKSAPSIQPDCSALSAEVIAGSSVTLDATVTNTSYYYLMQTNVGVVHAGNFNSSPANLYYTWKPAGSAGDIVQYVLELDNDCGGQYFCYFTVKILEPPPPPVPELSISDGCFTPDCDPVCFQWCAPDAQTVIFTIKATDSNQTIFESPSLTVTNCSSAGKLNYYPPLVTPGEYIVIMTAKGAGGTIPTSPQTFKIVTKPSVVGSCPIQLILNKPATSVTLSVQVANAVHWSIRDEDDNDVDSGALSLPYDTITTNLSPQSPTKYFLTLTNECGCSCDPCMIDVKVNEPPPLVTLSADKYCLTRGKDTCSSSSDPCCNMPGSVCTTLSWIITGANEATADLFANPPCTSTAQPVLSYSVGSGTSAYGPITVCLSEDTIYTLKVTNKDTSQGTGTATVKVVDYPSISLTNPLDVTGGLFCAVADAPLTLEWEAPTAEKVTVDVSCFDDNTLAPLNVTPHYGPYNTTQKQLIIQTPNSQALCQLCATATNKCGIQNKTCKWVTVKTACGPPVVNLKQTYPCCKTKYVQLPWGGIPILPIPVIELTGSVTGATEYCIIAHCGSNSSTIASGNGLNPGSVYDDINITAAIFDPYCTYELHAIGPGGESYTKIMLVGSCPPAPSIYAKGTPTGKVQACAPGQPWQLDWEVIDQVPAGVAWKTPVEIILQYKDDTGKWVNFSKIGKFYGLNGSTGVDLPSPFDCSKEWRFLLTAENCGGLKAEAVVPISGDEAAGSTCPAGCLCISDIEGDSLNLPFCTDTNGNSISCGNTAEIRMHCRKVCPDGCVCLSKDEAANPLLPYAYSVTSNGYPCECNPKNICGGTKEDPKLCFKECPDGCKCLPDSQAKESVLSLCLEQPCGYDSSGNPTNHCYELRKAVTPCPQNCECMTEQEALKKGYTTVCSDKPCSLPGEPLKYCYRRCPEGCSCITQPEADKLGYIISCGDEKCDPSSEDKYCFSPPLQTCSKTASVCPREQAKKQGYSAGQRCQAEPCNLDGQGNHMYCYPKPKAPIVHVSSDHSYVTAGDDVKVCWKVAGEGITEVLFSATGDEPISVEREGCKTFRPFQQTRYLVTAKNVAGSGQDAVTVGVGQPPVEEEICPNIISFAADCPYMTSDKIEATAALWVAPCTVCWSVTGPAGTTVSLSCCGAVGMSGTTEVQRGATVTLTARYKDCVRTSTVQVPR